MGELSAWCFEYWFRWGDVNIFTNILEAALEESVCFLFIASKSNIIGNIMFVFSIIRHDGRYATNNAFFLVKSIQIDAFVNIDGHKGYTWMLELLKPLFDERFDFFARRTPSSA